MYNSNWYNNLTQPPFSPPDAIFAPVWGVLYIMIFISLILYYRAKSFNKQSGYIYFTIQLLLNFAWSPVFFGMQNMHLALLIIILLDLFVALTIKTFYSVSKPAGFFLIPYFIWILFATYLNLGYLYLN